MALRKAPPFHLTLAHLVIGGALVFVAGNLVFAMSLRLLPGAILGLGCLGAAFVILREAKKNSFLATPVHLPFFALCMATGFALCLLAGQGHFFYAAEDWLIRDAVLADLSASALPAYSWDQAAWVLRAPLGMYLLPGALGRLAGLGAAHGLMFVQNACLSPCDLVSSWREVAIPRSANGDVDQYLARIDRLPGGLLAPPETLRSRVAEKGSCWPDHPFVLPEAK